MNIQIICIGKLKEKYWTDAIKEYSKRLSRFCSLEITELKESLLPANASAADEEKVKLEEGKEILKAIKDGTYVITLEIKGKALTSEELAARIDDLGIMGRSEGLSFDLKSNDVSAVFYGFKDLFALFKLHLFLICS